MNGIEKSKQCVYIILADNGKVKIGRTKDVKTRLSALKHSGGFEINDYYNTEYCSNAYYIEKEMHKHYSEFKKIGEWFEISFPESVEYLKLIFSENADFETEYQRIITPQDIDRLTSEEFKTQKCISTVEISKMLEIEHYVLLRKLDGRKVKGKNVKGYIEILSADQMVVSDFFIPGSYIDESGKYNKCYYCTKKGCEFLAHKFTGEKGVLFTARYINRFHEMENELVSKKQNNFQLDFSIKKRSQLPAIAKKSNWYNECKTMIEVICESYGIDRRTLYHRFLMYVSSDYDLELARAIYKRDRGYYPVYAMDIVDHFPELENELRDYIGTVYSYAIE